MPDYLNDLVDKRAQLDEQLESINERAAAEVRALSDAETVSAKDLTERIAIIDERLAMTVATAEASRKARALAERAAEFSTPPAKFERRDGRPIEATSWGQMFVESDEFRGYRGVGQSGIVALEGFLETRAPIMTTNVAIPHVLLPPRETPARPTPLLDVCDRVQVSSGVVDYVEIGADPVAAVVAEGAVKPEAAFTMTPRSATLDTLAHWVQITRQALEDAPYMRSLIEGKLRRGLQRKAEADMAAALVAATLPTASSASSLLAAIRIGVGTVQDAGYVPNAVLLNPADYAALDVDVMGATVDGPVIGQRFWGLTPVAASSQPAGTATVGDFSEGATLFDRGVSNVFVTDSHASLFISNILVILAEARVKSVITTPPAFCECTKTP